MRRARTPRSPRGRAAPGAVAGLRRALAEERRRAERRTSELERLTEVGRKLAVVLNPDELYQTIYAQMGQLMDTRNMFICLYDEAHQRLFFPFYFEDGQRVPPKERPLSHGLTDHIIRTMAPLLIAKDYQGTTERLGIEPFGPPTQCWMGVPMLAEGRVLGVIAIWNREREGLYDEKLMHLIQTFANQAAIAVRNAQLYEALHEREETYRAVVETAARAGEGVAIVQSGAGARRKLAYVNDEFVRLTGYTREELLRLSLEDLVPPDQIERMLGLSPRRGLPGLRHESTIVAKDGTMVPIEVSAGQGSIDGEVATVCFVRDITERQARERELIELKNFNAEIVEAAPVGISYLDQQGRITYENPAMLSIMGVHGPSSPALDTVISDHPSIRAQPTMAKALQGLMRGEPFTDLDLPFKALTGKEVEISVSGVPIVRGGLVAGAILLVRDVTSTRRYERELRDQRDFNRNIVDNAPIGIAYLDKEGQVTYENPYLLKAMGWREGMPHLGQGQPITDLPSIRAKPEFEERLAGLLRRGEAFRDLVLPYTSLYDRELVVSISGVPLREGSATRGAVLLLEDVTEKAGLEEQLKHYTENLEHMVEDRTRELRAANRGLEEARRSLETILASTADGIAALDPHGHLIYHNAKFSELVGQTQGTLQGKGFLDAVRPSTRDDQRELTEAHDALLRGEPLHALELDFTSARGEVLHGVLTALPIIEDGRVTGAVATLTDITDRKRLEDELRRYSQSLEQEVERRTARLVQSAKMAALGQLVAGVAHEINNPLAFVKSNTENLLEALQELRAGPLAKAIESGGVKDETELAALLQNDELRFLLLDASRLLDNNMRGLERISQIVLQLRNFASPQMGRMALADLNAVLRDTIAIFAPQFRDRVAIHEDYAELPRIRLDTGQFTQVVMNLLVNAAQAVPGKGNVWVTTRRQGPWVEVEVRDDGPGIPAEVLPKIWDPFFTTKEKGNTGLGLSISYQIVREHGGEIAVETQVGKGTRFLVRLPLDEERSP